MKIGFKPPSLPAVPDLARTPSPAGPIPVPVPRVMQGISSFTGGVERRFSVQFMKGIEARLSMTGLPTAQVQDLTRRFGTMSRAELDREGRVVDTLLAGAHPREAMAVYGFLAKLGSLVTPGGYRVAPNIERSWTITPPEGDPVVLANRAGASMKLGDGSSLAVTQGERGLTLALTTGEAALESMLGTAGRALTGDHAAAQEKLSGALEQLRAAKQQEQTLSMDTALAVATTSATIVVTIVAIVATVAVLGAATPLIVTGAVAAAAMTVVSSTPQLFEAMATLADAAGAPEAGKALRNDSKDLAEFVNGPLKPATTAVLLCCAAVTLVCSAPVEVARELTSLMSRAGQSAAPSRRNDPDAERAVVLLAAAHQGSRLRDHSTEAVAELGQLAAKVRGQARDTIITSLSGVLAGLGRGGGSLRALLD